MALKYTITHNGSEWASSQNVDSISIQNGSVTSSMTTPETRVLHCGGKLTPNDIVIGAKTLHCSGKKMADDVTIVAANAMAPRLVTVGERPTCFTYLNQTMTSWVPMQITGDTNGCVAVCYGNGRFVTMGSKTKVAYSDDGVTWVATSGSNTNVATALTYGNGIYVGANSSGFMYSTDGITWRQGTGVSLTSPNIAYGNGVFVANTNSVWIYYSTDGITWTTGSDRGRNSNYQVTYGNGLFVCVGEQGEISYSSNGQTWSTTTVSGGKKYYCVGYFNGSFIAYGEKGAGAISQNGMSWSKYTASGLPTSTSATDRMFTWDGKLFYQTGSSIQLYYTSNGTNWTQLPSLPSNTRAAVGGE